MQNRFLFRPAFLLFVLPFLLTGCGFGDTVYFTRRIAALTGPIPEATVVSAIKAVPGVTLEPTRESEPHTSFGLYTGFEHNQGGRVYSYYSLGANAGGNVAVTHTQSEGWTLSIDSGWMGRSPTPAEVQRSRRLNDRIYLNIRQRYPALPPLDQTRVEGMRP